MSRPTKPPGLTTVDRQVRRAKAAGYATGVSTYVLGFLGLTALKHMAPAATLYDLVQLLTQWAWVAGPLFGYLVYSRLVPPGGPVIWLRRFRPTQRGRFNFAAALGRASVGLGQPLTLQDASVSTSVYAAGVQSSVVLLWFLVLLLWLLAALASVAVATALHLKGGALLVGLLLATAGVGLLVWRCLGRFGFRALPSDEARALAQIRQRIEALRAGRRRVGIGIEVVRCPDVGNLWQDVVRTALAGTVAAIIDVTEMTPNIRFELAEALRLVGPDRVLLTVEEHTVAEQRIWLEVCEPAQRDSGVRLSGPWLSRVLHTYPSRQPPLGPQGRRVMEHEVLRLRAALGALAARSRGSSVRSER